MIRFTNLAGIMLFSDLICFGFVFAALQSLFLVSGEKSTNSAYSNALVEKADVRAEFPSLRALLNPTHKASALFSTSQIELEQSTSTPPPPSITTTGMTYLQFYSNQQCGGEITYTTGYTAGMCLPANDYVRPPFTNDDYFPYTFPFRSLRISNVTGK